MPKIRIHTRAKDYQTLQDTKITWAAAAATFPKQTRYNSKIVTSAWGSISQTMLGYWRRRRWNTTWPSQHELKLVNKVDFEAQSHWYFYYQNQWFFTVLRWGRPLSPPHSTSTATESSSTSTPTHGTCSSLSLCTLRLHINKTQNHGNGSSSVRIWKFTIKVRHN